MILYHYLSAHHLKGVARAGLTKGAIPWRLKPDGKATFKRGYQWLTTNSDFNQPWATIGLYSALPYRRNEYRIAIDIPNYALRSVINWKEFAQKYAPESADYLNSLGDAHHWRLFWGTIPTGWFIDIQKNPELFKIQMADEV